MRRAAPLLALTVGFVLADSAIVTLALPEILRRLGGTVPQVAWVLIAYNLVLAAAVLSAAWACARRDPAPLCAAGIAVFAAASAACALAGSMNVLIAARCVQALGGAFAVVGCLELLVAASDERRGVARWITAGVIGSAAGPVVGGLLTEAISWQAIFVVQVPVAVLAVPAALTARRTTVRRVAAQRPALAPNIALVLLSAALTAALFLLVLLLVEGWRRSPATAALTVSVVPAAAFAATPLTRMARVARAGPRAEAATGCLLLAGGLAGLALLPSARLAWTIAPQVLIGFGLGLTVDRLTLEALHDRVPRAVQGGWTIGARHIGVVLGLAVLTPVFTADLRAAQVPAQQAITALVLDAPLRTQDKIALAQGLGSRLAAQRDRVPDLHPAFAGLTLPAGERAAAAQLERDLDGQLERAATRAFRDSFLLAAGFALVASVPLIRVRRRVRALALPVAAVALVGGVLGVQVAHGGGRFVPARPASPCAARTITVVSTGIDGLGERLVLLGLDGAACRLGVTREALTLQLAESATPTDAQVYALRAGLLAAVARLKADGMLPRSSTLVGEALDDAHLNVFVKAAIRALPDSLIDSALKTDDVLRRTVDSLDLRMLLTNLTDPDQLTRQINAAVTKAVKDSLVARLRGLI